MLTRIALILVGLLVGFSAAELALRATDYRIALYGQHDGVIVQLDRRRLFRIPPGNGGDTDRWGCRLESRTHAWSLPHIILFGDSFVWGTAAPVGTSFAARLSQKLSPRHPVVNCGVPGYGPDQSLLLLRERQPFFQRHTQRLSSRSLPETILKISAKTESPHLLRRRPLRLKRW